jgi:hypothetical protein
MHRLPATLFLLLATAPVAAQLPSMTKEHKLLAKQAGRWDAEMEYLDFETGKPARSKGISIRRQPLGGFWLIDNFQAEMMGMQFKGMGTTGYDPLKKKLVGTWIDSMTPSLMVVEGGWDKDRKVMTLSGMGVGQDGKPSRTTLKTTVHSDDRHVFEMFSQMPDGNDVKVMEITYTRRKRELDAVRK